MTERKIEVFLKEDRDPVSVIPVKTGIQVTDGKATYAVHHG
jgi:hypothetical protein